MRTNTRTSSAAGLLSRRALLKAGGALVVSFSLGSLLTSEADAQGPPPGGAPTAPPRGLDGKSLDPTDVDAFLALHPDGRVTIYTSKVDVGQGLRIALAQLVAEELDVPIARVSVVQGDTATCPDHGGTGGSTGLPRGGVEIRQAAATARQALLGLASTRLGRPAAELTIVEGEIRPAAGGAGVTIAALVGGRALALKVDRTAPLKRPATYGVVGKPLLRTEVPAKATGRYTYVGDVRVPGMLHGRVVRPPAIGATLTSVDESSIRAIPGVRVVRVQNFLAVVAADEWAAVRGARELKATWTPWTGLPPSATLQSWSRGAEIAREETVIDRGTVEPALAGAAKRVGGQFYWPYQSHASLGPACAVADVKADGSTTVWSASQGIPGLRTTLARVFELPLERLRVIFTEGPGSYGTNGTDHVAADAVLLSKTVRQPVRVQWMRADEFGWAPKGPQQLVEAHAGIDAAGTVVGWDVEMWLGAQAPGARAFPAADAAGLTQERGNAAGAMTQNADPPYGVTNVRVRAHWLKTVPLQQSNLRAPGKVANVFAAESLADELASAAGEDPLRFRTSRLRDPRALDVLARVAERFAWTPRTAPTRRREGRLLIGQGLAYIRYKQAENYVAMAMEVAVDPQTGAIAVRRIVCAHDCGLIVNPDGLRNQVEGCIVQGLSRALHEEVTFDASRVTSVDWVGYPILRFPEAPAVDVILIDRPDQPIVGAGEAATAPVPAALANAVFDATGVRLRVAPFTAARVKAALAQGT